MPNRNVDCEKPNILVNPKSYVNNRKFGFTLAEGATHVGRFADTRKFAFTLAEVLITLGIIGVVAAITIPALVQNYKKHIIENTLLQSVSVLQQAVVRSAVDNDTPDTWGIENYQKDTFDIYIKPYLNVSKVCTGYVDNPQDLCNTAMYHLNGNKMRLNLDNRYYLNNNSSIIFCSAGTKSISQRRGAFYIVPQNKKEKLIVGKNVFVFNLVLQDNIKYSITSKTDYAVQNDFCNFTKEKNINFCINSSGNTGYVPGINCSAMIECNGWKIPKDYPTKF